MASVELLEPVERVAAAGKGPAGRTVMCVERCSRRSRCGPGERTGVRGRHAGGWNAAQRLGEGTPPMSDPLGRKLTSDCQADQHQGVQDSATQRGDPPPQGAGNDTALADPRWMRRL
jgi:hypothetical protein